MTSDLVSWLDSCDPDYINMAEQYLKTMTSDTAWGELNALVCHPIAEVRGNVLHIGESLFPQKVGEMALKLLDDSESAIRWQACEIIHKRDFQPAVEKVSQLLILDCNPLVRNMAAIALGKLGIPSTIPILRKALREEQGTDHEGTPIREKIERTLRAITSKYQLDDLNR